jgi:hypothetical protein
VKIASAKDYIHAFSFFFSYKYYDLLSQGAGRGVARGFGILPVNPFFCMYIRSHIIIGIYLAITRPPATSLSCPPLPQKILQNDR